MDFTYAARNHSKVMSPICQAVAYACNKFKIKLVVGSPLSHAAVNTNTYFYHRNDLLEAASV